MWLLLLQQVDGHLVRSSELVPSNSGGRLLGGHEPGGLGFHPDSRAWIVTLFPSAWLTDFFDRLDIERGPVTGDYLNSADANNRQLLVTNVRCRGQYRSSAKPHFGYSADRHHDDLAQPAVTSLVRMATLPQEQDMATAADPMVEQLLSGLRCSQSCLPAQELSFLHRRLTF